MTAREFRIQAGLSIEDMAKKLGRNPDTIRGYERNGINEPHIAKRVAKAYGCSYQLFRACMCTNFNKDVRTTKRADRA